MKYYIDKIIGEDFITTVSRTREALKSEGFGIISEIDLHEKFKEKLDVKFRNYKILGACIPELAHKAVLSEDKIGTMLPCNVVIQSLENRQTEVVAVDPLSSMKAVENKELKKIAGKIRERLEKVIESIN